MTRKSPAARALDHPLEGFVDVGAAAFEDEAGAGRRDHIRLVPDQQVLVGGRFGPPHEPSRPQIARSHEHDPHQDEDGGGQEQHVMTPDRAWRLSTAAGQDVMVRNFSGGAETRSIGGSVRHRGAQDGAAPGVAGGCRVRDGSRPSACGSGRNGGRVIVPPSVTGSRRAMGTDDVPIEPGEGRPA